jgi:hypothetical protein
VRHQTLLFGLSIALGIGGGCAFDVGSSSRDQADQACQGDCDQVVLESERDPSLRFTVTFIDDDPTFASALIGVELRKGSRLVLSEECGSLGNVSEADEKLPPTVVSCVAEGADGADSSETLFVSLEYDPSTDSYQVETKYFALDTGTMKPRPELLDVASLLVGTKLPKVSDEIVEVRHRYAEATTPEGIEHDPFAVGARVASSLGMILGCTKFGPVSANGRLVPSTEASYRMEMGANGVVVDTGESAHAGGSSFHGPSEKVSIYGVADDPTSGLAREEQLAERIIDAHGGCDE